MYLNHFVGLTRRRVGKLSPVIWKGVQKMILYCIHSLTPLTWTMLCTQKCYIIRILIHLRFYTCVFFLLIKTEIYLSSDVTNCR